MEGQLPNDLRYFHWAFPTVEGRPPIEVELGLARLKDTSGDEYGLRIEVGGLLHPYYGSKQYNIGGEVTQNPALLPAADVLKQEIRESLAKELQKIGLSIADATSTEWNTGNGHYFMNLAFNPTAGARASRGIKRVGEAELVALSDTVKRDIDQLTPQIQQLIDDNRHLQPSMNPESKDIAKFDNKVGRAWATAMRDIENKGAGRARGGSITPKIEDN